MSEPLKLLESDWDVLLEQEQWQDMGKCLRAIVKIHKNACTLSQNAYEIQKRINVLECNLNAVEPKIRFSLVGDIIYARNAIDSSTNEEYGAAYKSRNVKRHAKSGAETGENG